MVCGEPYEDCLEENKFLIFQPKEKINIMRLYSYIVAHDTGFSPNPFWGYCTLSCCKPRIRRTAEIQDWVVGLSPKANGNRIVYAMKIDEILSFGDYFNDRRFTAKIPDFKKSEVVFKCGDNIYEPLPSGGFRQLMSKHSNGAEEHLRNKVRDLSGLKTLISKNYYYFGSKGPALPVHLWDLKVGIGHKSRFPQELISNFVQFISTQKMGINGPPTTWSSSSDMSWRLGI